jgi:hypothetical protein
LGSFRLKIKDCVWKECAKHNGEEATTHVLTFSGLLTPAIARKLQVGECYDDAGVPHSSWSSYPSPGLKITGADVWLGEKDFRATLIHKVKVVAPKTGNDNDTHLEVSMRVHFAQKEGAAVGAWCDRQLKAAFIFEMSAAQGDLSFQNAEEEDEPAEETEKDTGCPSCNNGVEMGIGKNHLNGQRCTALKTEPALASAREVEGPKRKRQVAKPEAGDETAETPVN